VCISCRQLLFELARSFASHRPKQGSLKIEISQLIEAEPEACELSSASNSLTAVNSRAVQAFTESSIDGPEDVARGIALALPQPQPCKACRWLCIRKSMRSNLRPAA
jgi:hypothetical protein